MASKLNYSAALEKARMDANTTIVGNAGKLWIYKGTQEAGPGTVTAQTVADTSQALLDMLAQAMQQMQAAMGQHAQAMAMHAQAANTPKRIVRDPMTGRAVGVEPVRTMQ